MPSPREPFDPQQPTADFRRCVPGVTLPDGTPWLANKLIRGPTLSSLLPTRDADDLSRDRANTDALSRDRKGADHRRADAPRSPSDLKASRQRDLPSETPDHTAAGTILGTPSYMAPEQARGMVVDQRADVFALGSILATILTGQPEFVGHSK